MVYNFIMRYISLLITLLLFSLSAHTAIEDREFLNEIFDGCVANEVDILDAGESFEYCGCVVNTISKEMDMRELSHIHFFGYSIDNTSTVLKTLSSI